MNIDYSTYYELTYCIFKGFFPQDVYFPAIGRANIVELFVKHVSKNKEAKSINIKTMSASEYVDKVYPMIADEFAEAMKDSDYFSFRNAIKDAQEMVKFRCEQIVRENEYEDLLDTLIRKNISEIIVGMRAD